MGVEKPATTDRSSLLIMGGLEPIHTTSASHFSITWLCTAITCGMLLAPLNRFYVNYYQESEPAWIRNLYFQKSIIADRQAARGSRLIFFGGSGVLFGIDAQLIEKKLGIPTVNFGTQGGMGVRYILDSALSILRPGDTAVLIIEYGSYADHWRVHPGAFHQFIWTYDNAYLRHMPIREMAGMFWSVELMDYVNSFQGWRDRFSENYYHLKELAKYSVGTMDSSGDIHVAPSGPVHQNTGAPFSTDPGIYDLNAFRQFVAAANAKKIRVMFSWPAYIRPKLAPGESLDPPQYMTELFRQTGMIDLDQPSDNMYPTDFFLDSSYHLNSSGRRIHTEEMIRRLRPFFGLPAAHKDSKTLYLVAGREHHLTPGNLFLDDPNIQVRYLSQTDLSDETITPAEVARLIPHNIRVVTDSDAAGPLLASAGLTEKICATRRESVNHWFARYSSNILMIGAAPGVHLDPAWQSALPPQVYHALSIGGPCAAIFGTGQYQNVMQVASNNNSVFLHADTPSLLPPGRRMPAHLEIESLSKSSAGPRLRMSVDYLDTATLTTGLFAIALDPELGSIVDSHAFDGKSETEIWHMNQVSLPSGP